MLQGVSQTTQFSPSLRMTREMAAKDLRIAAKQLLDAAETVLDRVVVLEALSVRDDYGHAALRKLTEEVDETRWRLGFLGRSLDAFYKART